MPEREALSLGFRIILLLMFLGVLIITTLLMTSQIKIGWVTALFTSIGRLLVP